MQPALRTMLGALPILLLGLEACTPLEEVAACYLPGKAPNSILSTHKLIPYPGISQRLGEHGTTWMTVNIGTDGVLTDITISQSSHSMRLDEAAATYIKANYRWQPAPEGCTPTTAQARILVIWRLDPLAGDNAVIATEADYPPSALDRAEQGITLLAISVGDGGTVNEVRIAGSSGYSDLDTKSLALMKNKLRSMDIMQAGTQYVNFIWSLPASAIAAQKRKGIEILDVHAPTIQIQAQL